MGALRQNVGNRLVVVIASAAKQSSLGFHGILDCFAALAMTKKGMIRNVHEITSRFDAQIGLRLPRSD